MKFNFKRIASVITGAVMLSSTVALAAAAANQFPEPFVKSGSADVAIVHGSNANVAQTDVDAAFNIGKKINNDVVTAAVTPTTTPTVTGDGDKFDIKKGTTNFHIGNGALDVLGSGVLDSDELPTMLASGKYLDNDNDEFDYEQKVTLSNFSVSMFDDDEYAKDSPTVGVRIASGSHVLNYSLEFNDNPNMTDLATSTLPIMGKEYYVLSVSGITQITLLDSAETILLKEGETKTVTIDGKTYEISLSFIGASSVKFEVNGQTTTSISEAQTYKLKDGAYIGVKDISVQDYAGGMKQVEFGIGAGKLLINNAQDVQLNEESITRLKGYITPTSGDLLSKITLEWKADGDQFAAENSTIVMPGFSALQLGFAGVDYPEEEEIKIAAGGDDYISLVDFPLKGVKSTVDVLFSSNNVNFTTLGKDATTQIAVGATNITFIEGTHEYFVATYSDGSREAESYLVRMQGLSSSNGKNYTDIAYLTDTGWTTKYEDKEDGDSGLTIGSAELTIEKVIRSDTEDSVRVVAGAGTNFNTLYSEEGMKLVLPWINTTAVTLGATANMSAAGACTAGADGTTSNGIGEIGYNQVITYNNTATKAIDTVTCTSYPTSVAFQFWEEDKDGDIAQGKNINVTASFTTGTSTAKVEVTTVTGASSSNVEIGDTDVFRSFTYSDLATEILEDTAGDQDDVTLVYHGGEVVTSPFVASSAIQIGTGDGGVVNTGIPQLLDSQVATQAANKNLIVVGGSCINTVAAKLLGSDTPLCGADFTAKTKSVIGQEVGAGSYLVATFASPYNANKVAMLVAGYEAADTVSAASYLTNNMGNVTTAVGDKIVNGAKVTVSA